MRVIGTAGHVDHGKSTLVKALTGIDPDRLKEEKLRQMTIDLGFAFLDLDTGEQVGIVDVPGHRDFIENMLAGVGGIDAVLLVIAADEGVMPQTREHLAIIDLLKIQNGLIVLTKVDLVKDSEYLELLENDIRQILKGTMLAKASIVRVSSVTGQGIGLLKKDLSVLLEKIPQAQDIGRPRLPVDRVFSIQGFGTVVTGTLSGGNLHTGDLVEILVSKKMGRIRGLQSHNKKEDVAKPGSRTAVNVSGIDQSEIKRGDVVSLPGILKPTRRIDARIEILSDATSGLQHNDQVKFFLATSERIARIRLLGKLAIEPGDFGWVQLEFEKELVAEKGDRFIIRRSSPAETIGGGIVVTADPIHRYKLFDEGVIARFEARLKPSISERLLTLIEDGGFLREVEIHTALTDFESDLERLIDQKQIMLLDGKKERYYISAGNWEKISQRLVKILSEYHAKNPLKFGMLQDELKNRVSIHDEIIRSCIQKWNDSGLIQMSKQRVALPGFQIRYSPQQRSKLDSFTRLIEQNPFNPPNISDMKLLLGAEVFQSLIDQESLIQVSSEIAYRDGEYQQMVEFVKQSCQNGEILTIGQFRDHFSTSRKFALAFLEHLDRKGITERDGEGRRLKPI